MSPLLSLLLPSLLSRYTRRLGGRKPRRTDCPRAGERRKRRRQPLYVEHLEDRTLPSASIHISDATVKEQGNLSTFIPGNGAVLRSPRGMAFGPDRNGDSAQDLYVLGDGSNNIVVYDGTTGAFVEEYVPLTSAINGSAWVTFGANGDLYTSTVTATGLRDSILRVDHATRGVSTFVPNNANGGLENAKGLAFGPDGNLYVACATTNRVLRYDGTTGAFINAFVSAGSGGLAGTSGVLFGPDRNEDSVPELYVGSNDTDQVLLFDGVNGSSLGAFVAAGSGGLDGPHSMQFGPDGNLYVVSSVNTLNFDQVEQVFRFDGTTGAFIDIPVAVGSGLGGATAFIAFDLRGELFVSGQGAHEVLRYSAGPLVTLSEASATPVTVEFGTAAGTATQGGDYAAVSGRFTFAPGQTSKRILVSAVDDGTSEGSEAFTVNLSNAAGATIADGQGVVTILNSQTRFFVVNDMTTSPTGAVVRDETYKYESDGTLVVANDVYFSATAVRGVASNAAGTRLWMLDANRTVYVCDHRNVFLGSWTAGGLHALAQVEGIATNGTDVWLVDARQDRVYRYANAAGRLSGSQSATSSFNLNSGNRNPKGIVTDGTSLWVVDDSSTDKVFKYTLTGTLVGSWTITAGGGSPTGITLDPTAPSHLWVVDNGTDRVYQYDNAVTRTSGSQTASATFALAAGNTNPQDIADPPPPGMLLAPLPAPFIPQLMPASSPSLGSVRFSSLESTTPSSVAAKLPLPAHGGWEFFRTAAAVALDPLDRAVLVPDSEVAGIWESGDTLLMLALLSGRRREAGLLGAEMPDDTGADGVGSGSTEIDELFAQWEDHRLEADSRSAVARPW